MPLIVIASYDPIKVSDTTWIDDPNIDSLWEKKVDSMQESNINDYRGIFYTSSWYCESKSTLQLHQTFLCDDEQFVTIKCRIYRSNTATTDFCNVTANNITISTTGLQSDGAWDLSDVDSMLIRLNKQPWYYKDVLITTLSKENGNPVQFHISLSGTCSKANDIHHYGMWAINHIEIHCHNDINSDYYATKTPTRVTYIWSDDFIFTDIIKYYGWYNDSKSQEYELIQVHGDYTEGEYHLKRYFLCESLSTVWIQYTIIVCGDSAHASISLYVNEKEVDKIYGNDDRRIVGEFDDILPQNEDCTNGWQQIDINETGDIFHTGDLFEIVFVISSLHSNDHIMLTDIKVICEQIPTTEPTYDPTYDPTVPPTTPTLTPTNNPSKYPTYSPSYSPSTAPTSNPTEPTISPTIDPSVDPTIDPTMDPTLDPTITPTLAPTLAPSLAPSFAPTLTPTSTPSSPPSVAPSSAPTVSPSLAPTIAPTVIGATHSHVELYIYYNMTEALSNIILTIFTDKLSYATRLGIKYGLYQRDYEKYKFLFASYTCAAFTIPSINKNTENWNDDLFDCDEHSKALSKTHKYNRYTPSTHGAQYLGIIKIILTGNDHDDADHKAEELKELLKMHNNTNTTATPHTRRTLQEAVAFIEVHQQCMNQEKDLENILDEDETCTGFLGLDLEHFEIISLDAEFAAEPFQAPPKSLIAKFIVESLRLFIYIFIGCCLIAAIFGTFHAKKVNADNVKAVALFFFSIYTWDFYSDIMFSVRLAEYCVNKEKYADTVWWLFAISTLFVIIPWILNLLQLFKAQRKWTTDSSVQEGVRGWFVDWSNILIVAVALSGSSFGAIELANSNLFGFPLFCMGLSSRHLKAFQGKRFFSSVLFENAPQLVLQIYFLTLLHSLDEATFVALLSSCVSMLLSVVDIWSAKHLISVMRKHQIAGKDVMAIEFNIDTINQSFDEIHLDKKTFLAKPNALKKAIAETLAVLERNIEIYQLIAANPGIKVGFTVYALNKRVYVFIKKLKREIRQFQLLISIYWEMKSYPNVTDISRGHNIHLVSKSQHSNIETNLELPPTLGFKASSISSKFLQIIQPTLLANMNTTDRILIKATDPEYNANLRTNLKTRQYNRTESLSLSLDDSDDDDESALIALKLWSDFLSLNVVDESDDEEMIWNKYIENIERLIECHRNDKCNEYNVDESNMDITSEWVLSLQNMQMLLNKKKEFEGKKKNTLIGAKSFKADEVLSMIEMKSIEDESMDIDGTVADDSSSSEPNSEDEPLNVVGYRASVHL